MKYVLLCLLVVVVGGCWLFEKTDDRPSPIGDATQAAAQAYEDAQTQLPTIPGTPTWLIGLVGGLAAAAGAFVDRLILRKQQLNAKPQVASPPPSPPGG